MDYARYALTDDETLAYPSYPLERDFPKEEYDLRIGRARDLMAAGDLDALVITSSVVGRWFTKLCPLLVLIGARSILARNSTL